LHTDVILILSKDVGTFVASFSSGELQAVDTWQRPSMSAGALSDPSDEGSPHSRSMQ